MLTPDSKRVKADGGISNDSISFHRVSGGPELAGQWKTKNLKTSSPETLSLTQKGSDDLTMSLGNAGGVCDANFDGKEMYKTTLVVSADGKTLTETGSAAPTP